MYLDAIFLTDVFTAIISWRASRAQTPSDDIRAQMKATGGDIVHVLDRLMQVRGFIVGMA
jgi:hypothetical protein